MSGSDFDVAVSENEGPADPSDDDFFDVAVADDVAEPPAKKFRGKGLTEFLEIGVVLACAFLAVGEMGSECSLVEESFAKLPDQSPHYDSTPPHTYKTRPV